ncbi:MAG TPA: ion channel [Acidimicrobiales bacterium]|jgi:hypothetical protein
MAWADVDREIRSWVVALAGVALSLVVDVFGVRFVGGVALILVGTGLAVALGVGRIEVDRASVRRRRLVFAVLAASGIYLAVYGYARLYADLSAGDPAAFTDAAQPGDTLGAADSLYFSFTTFTTTGFGDIHAASGVARAVVVSEMAVAVAIAISAIARLTKELGG